MRLIVCLTLLLTLLFGLPALKAIKHFCIAQEVTVFEPTGEAVTGPPIFGFDFSFPNVGMTNVKVHAEPLPEVVDYLRRLLGNENRAKILRIENNETLIDEKNKRVAAIMRHDDGTGDVFEIGYVFEGVDQNIAAKILIGNLFSGSVKSRIVIRRKLPDGDILSFLNTLEDPLSSSMTSEIGDIIQKGEDAKVFVKVTKVRKGRKINSQGVEEKILLTSGYGKVRVRNGAIKIQEFSTRKKSSSTLHQTNNVINIPLVILVFSFKDCPTIIKDIVASKIESLFGSNIEDIGVIQ